MKTVEEKIMDAICTVVEIDPERVTMESDISTDLYIDSLDAYELQYMLERDFGIEIPDGLFIELHKVKDFHEWLKKGNHI